VRTLDSGSVRQASLAARFRRNSLQIEQQTPLPEVAAILGFRYVTCVCSLETTCFGSGLCRFGTVLKWVLRCIMTINQPPYQPEGMFSPRKDNLSSGTIDKSPAKKNVQGAFLNGIWHCECEPRLPAEHFQTKNGGQNHGRWCTSYSCSSEGAPATNRLLL